MADHLSRLKFEDESDEYFMINDLFPYENELKRLDALDYGINGKSPWYADIVNYLASEYLDPELTGQAKYRFLNKCRSY